PRRARQDGAERLARARVPDGPREDGARVRREQTYQLGPGVAGGPDDGGADHGAGSLRFVAAAPRAPRTAKREQAATNERRGLVTRIALRGRKALARAALRRDGARSALRVLELLAGARLTGLLALLLARVAREETRLLERAAVLGVDVEERARDAVP